MQFAGDGSRVGAIRRRGGSCNVICSMSSKFTGSRPASRKPGEQQLLRARLQTSTFKLCGEAGARNGWCATSSVRSRCRDGREAARSHATRATARSSCCCGRVVFARRFAQARTKARRGKPAQQKKAARLPGRPFLSHGGATFNGRSQNLCAGGLSPSRS